MNWIKKMLGSFTPEEMARIARDEAAVALLEHELAAEHHAALSAMYRQREKRLSERLEAEKAVEP